MIVFDLECRSGGHCFEGWFGSSDDFARQQQRGLVTCPSCGSAEIGKAVMAPNVARKGNQNALVRPKPSAEQTSTPGAGGVANSGPSIPPEAAKLFTAIAEAQAEALKTSRWVGTSFAETARAIHYGEREAEQVHGQATRTEAQDLIEEGIVVAPVLFPLVPPGEAN